MGEVTIRVRGDLDAVLDEELYDFNAAAVGRDDGLGLGFAAEADGEVVAGVSGYTWAGIAEVKLLWVREGRRGEGLGRRLMEAAIAEARARGCARMFLSTHSFQAPEFYRSLGFELVATIPDKPLGHSEHWFQLAL